MHLNPESLSFALLISDFGSIARAANILGMKQSYQKTHGCAYRKLESDHSGDEGRPPARLQLADARKGNPLSMSDTRVDFSAPATRQQRPFK
jgi:hypothetical protein